MARAGFAAITWGTKWVQTLSFIVISPLLGMLAGYILMVIVFWLFHRTSAARVDRFFRPAQLVSSALLSYSHGGNDAQKTMGIIVGLLVSVQGLFANQTGWLHALLSAPTTRRFRTGSRSAPTRAISLGTLFGGWRIVHTMGSRITKLRPVGGFCAETGGAAAILIATHFGIPVSTTHTITGSIVGVGATQRAVGRALGDRRAHRVGVGPDDPAAGIMAAISYHVLAARSCISSQATPAGTPNSRTLWFRSCASGVLSRDPFVTWIITKALAAPGRRLV